MVTEADRLHELEKRIERLESELARRERGPLRVSTLTERVLPSDARSHLRASWREQLLAMRVFVDRAIERVGRGEERHERD